METFRSGLEAPGSSCLSLNKYLSRALPRGYPLSSGEQGREEKPLWTSPEASALPTARHGVRADVCGPSFASLPSAQENACGFRRGSSSRLAASGPAPVVLPGCRDPSVAPEASTGIRVKLVQEGIAPAREILFCVIQ